jgi:hypothetical protein
MVVKRTAMNKRLWFFLTMFFTSVSEEVKGGSNMHFNHANAIKVNISSLLYGEGVPFVISNFTW